MVSDLEIRWRLQQLSRFPQGWSTCAVADCVPLRLQMSGPYKETKEEAEKRQLAKTFSGWLYKQGKPDEESKRASGSIVLCTRVVCRRHHPQLEAALLDPAQRPALLLRGQAGGSCLPQPPLWFEPALNSTCFACFGFVQYQKGEAPKGSFVVRGAAIALLPKSVCDKDSSFGVTPPKEKRQ